MSDPEPDLTGSEAESVPADGSVFAPGFPVVGIGASAGGLEALGNLLEELPFDTGMAFVIVQHLARSTESHLATILARSTDMPVVEAGDGMAISPDHVYVTPPGKRIEISEGKLNLIPPTDSHKPNAIDHFFRSLASELSHRAIGVILSGALNDGTAGLAEIKVRGGLTFAQDDSAGHASMPQSAIESGSVDFILSPGEIAKELGNLARHPYVDGTGGANLLPENDHKGVTTLIQRATGVDFSRYKSSTLQRRISRRMLVHKLKTLKDYERQLRESPGEMDALYHDILIGVTTFFRNPEVFESLKSTLFPGLLANRNEGEPLRVWCLGCSTGEEAYSLAMAFAECAGDDDRALPVHIFASDLNARGVEHARAGLYPQGISDDVSPERLERFFTEEKNGYRIKKSIRDCCIFAQHNALADPPFSRLDFISCRNMLIYLEPVLQQQVFRTLHFAVKPGGYLWLGSSESLGSSRSLFELTDAGSKLFCRRPGPTVGMKLSRVVRSRLHERGQIPRESAVSEVHRDAERLLAARFSPPGIVITTGMEIIQFRGDTGRYLTPAAGMASLHLMKMLRDGLLAGARAAISRAQSELQPAREEGLVVRTEEGFSELAIEAVPIKSKSGKVTGFVILFDDSPPKSGEKKKSAPVFPPEESDREIIRLNQELAATRDFLESTIEQNEATSEELQSANEEAQSSNEELQSLNEELETSKEEIQSTNEELSSVNDELNNRNLQLQQSNADLNSAKEYAEKIVASVRVPLLVLDGGLRVKTASAAFYERFNLTPETTIGEVIYDLGNRQWDFPELRTLLEKTLPAERNVDRFEISHTFEKLGSRVMVMRACRLPEPAERQEVVVLSIEDITDRTNAEAALRESEEFNRSIVESSRDCIKILGTDGTLLMMTEGGRKMLSIEDLSEFIGKSWIGFWQEEDREGACAAVEAAAAGGIGSLVGMLATMKGEERWWDVKVTPISDANGQVARLLAVSRDVTEGKRIQLNANLLASVSEEIFLLTDEAEVLQLAGARIAKYLDLTGCVFLEVDEATENVELTHEWRRDPSTPSLGGHGLAGYFTDEFREASKSGMSIEVADTRTDPGTDAAHFGALGIMSLISVPVLRGGAWRCSLGFHRSVSQPWREDEVDFVNELTPRIFAHIERVRSEETSARLAAIVEFSDDAIIGKDLGGIINSWNRGAERLFGYSAREAIGQPVSMLMPPELKHEEESVLDRIRRGQVVDHYETIRRVKDGRLIDIALTVSPIFNAAGEVIGASKIARDITARKLSEDALAASEKRFRTMANAINQLAWIARPDGYITWYNKSWYDYTGTSPAQMEGWGWQRVHSEAELPLVMENWTAAISTGDSFEMTFPLRGADGIFRQFLTRVISLKDSNGEVEQWFGTNTDVSELTRVEEALRENNQRMILATRATGVGIWEWDIENDVLQWDAEMFRIYGIPPTEDGIVPYTAWSNAVHPDDLAEQEDALTETIRGNNCGTRDFRIRNAETDEWRNIQVVDAIRHDSQGNPKWVVGTNLDITETERANQNNTFLAAISKDLLKVSGVADLIHSIGKDLVAYLGLSCCTFAEVDEKAETLEIIRDVPGDDGKRMSHTHDLPGLLGAEALQSLLAGNSVVIQDMEESPRPVAQLLKEFGLGSCIAVPEFQNGRLSFLVLAGDTSPREWRQDEKDLVREVAVRLWARLARSRAEEALARTMVDSEQQRRLYHTVLSNTPDFIYVIGLDHRFSYINDALLKVYGMSWEEAKDKDWIGLGYEQWHAEMHDREIDQVIATKAPIRGEIPFVGTSGRKVYDYIFCPVFGKNGEVEAVAGTTRDITERKLAESAQAAERIVFERIATGGTLEQTLETLLRETESQSPDGMLCSILLLDKGGKNLVTAAAPSLPVAYVAAMQNLPVGPSVGSCGTAAFRGEPVYVKNISTDPRWKEFRELAASNNLAACCSLPIHSLEGQILGTLAMYYPKVQEPGTQDRELIERAMKLAAIIIERKKTEESLAEQTATLLRADRSKDEFLAMLAHELRNPLAPIRNATGILQNPASTPDDKNVAQQLIARQTDNMSRMIDDLLDVSRITEGKIELRREILELQKILRSAVDTIRLSFEQNGQTFSISLPDDPVFVDADPTRLEQLFSNLLSNACKYSGEGAEINLTVDIIAEDEVSVSVTDNGSGIDPEILPSIFDLFVQSSRTLDRSHGGLGIGLTIVHRLVKLHGGSIEAHSAGLGKGAEFIVRFPVVDAPEATETPEPGTTGQGRPLRILIVDDNRDAAETLDMLLGFEGHDVRTAFSGKAALAIAPDFAPEFVILDIGLPEMDGFEVARRLRKIPLMEDAFLVALTGYGSDADRRQAKDAGFDEHLVKPADLGLLGEWLRKVAGNPSKQSTDS